VIDTTRRIERALSGEIGVTAPLFVNMSAVRRIQETAVLFVLLYRLALTTATAGEIDYVYTSSCSAIATKRAEASSSCQNRHGQSACLVLQGVVETQEHAVCVITTEYVEKYYGMRALQYVTG